MKLLMIHAWNATEVAYRGRFSSLLSYPSLTLAVLYSLIPKDIFTQIDVIDENSQCVQYDAVHYDVVMLSFETSSALSAYRHCDAFRERGSYVVCGGYHATALPEEVGEGPEYKPMSRSAKGGCGGRKGGNDRRRKGKGKGKDTRQKAEGKSPKKSESKEAQQKAENKAVQAGEAKEPTNSSSESKRRRRPRKRRGGHATDTKTPKTEG